MATLLERVFGTKGYRILRTLETHPNEPQEGATVIVADLGAYPAKRIQESRC